MRHALLPFLLLICQATWADTPQYEWDNVQRVVVVGDVHGAYTELEALLKANAIIDAHGSWIAGQTHLVSLGDLLDRGPDSRKAMDLFMRLTEEAGTAGGKVHVLLGNHELMNLSGDLRDVSEAEFAAFGDFAGHRAAFAPNGHYGRWLMTLPAAIRINGNIYLHGGLSPVVNDMSIVGINLSLQEDLHRVLTLGAELQAAGAVSAEADLLNLDEEALGATPDVFRAASRNDLFGSSGPLWYRGNAMCHALIETPNVNARLRQFAVDRIVIAHTPTATREVTARLDGKVVMADTGMLKSFYRGNARLLEFTDGPLRIFGPDGEQRGLRTDDRKDPELERLTIENFYADTQTLRFTDGTSARFLPLKGAARRRALAAYRLDRLLGVDMVPATAVRTVDGKEGVVMSTPGYVMSEADRIAAQQFRPNHCYKATDYNILAAFDALIGFRARNADNLAYVLPEWRIYLMETHKTFGSSSALPQYAAPPQLPEGLAQRIGGLTPQQLEKEFDGLLKKNEIRALLKRRDAILEWPRTP